VSGLLAVLFVHPMHIERWQQTLLLLPLCLSISLVYKTTRCAELRQIPLATLALWITIVLGMYLVGVGLWVVYTVFG